MATHPIPPSMSKDEAYLGVLAMKFRGTRDVTARQAIAAEYSSIVTRLLGSGLWNDMPAPEDQLPDEWMPKAFFEFWAHGRDAP